MTTDQLIQFISVTWPIITAIILGPSSFLITKFITTPVFELKAIKREISASLIRYAIVTCPNKPIDDDPLNISMSQRNMEIEWQEYRERKKEYNRVYDMFRGFSGDLRAVADEIPKYDKVARLFNLPSRGNIEKASANLMGWANSMGSDSLPYRDRFEHANAVEDALGIHRH